MIATLTLAADEHQFDRRRDYFVYEHLWVQAFLIRDGKQSAVRAGLLRRFVPPFETIDSKTVRKERDPIKDPDRFWDSLLISRVSLLLQ